MSSYNPPDPMEPQSSFRPPVAPGPEGYQQSTGYAAGQNPNLPQNGQPGFSPVQEQSPQPLQQDMSQLNTQMANMNVAQEGYGSVRSHKKKDRHAYHALDTPQAASAAFPGTSQSPPAGQQQFTNPNAQQQWQQQHGFSSPATQQPGAGGAPIGGAQPALTGTPASTTQGRVDPEQVPSVPWSRDGPAQYYLDHVYPTMEQHLPPPASVPFVAADQGNSSPKFARLTLNNIPASSEWLNATSLPLGLLLQPLAPQQDGDQPVPVIDFGEKGPPRCRRCRTYINPFMIFRSGGNKFVCNMCTFPNDTEPEYFSPTDPSGVRVDRAQRPELMLGTVEFAAPKEYWTKEPVPIRWLFLIDVSAEAISKGFVDAFCQGLISALYGESPQEEQNGETNGERRSRVPPGSKIGIATFDKEAHFYNMSPGLDRAQMVVMPDIEDPFVPLAEGLFVDPEQSHHMITSLLTDIPKMFARIKNPEPALLPALNSAMGALTPTGGRVVCSLSSLPTWGPGRLFLREQKEMADTEAERKLFTTEHPGYLKVAKTMAENGIGCDFFFAAPQGGYLDIATIGYVAEKTGGECYYYPNFQAKRDVLRVSKELKRNLTRESGFQALMKVRCSNGLQVAAYSGNFIQHTLGADLELGVIDADKAFGVSFSYDGKLDPKLDAHFQTALLYTSSSGQRRVRLTNIVASVSEHSLESMKFVDQDAIVSILAKQAVTGAPERALKDIRAKLSEKAVDILAAYRRTFSVSHPPGQLVLPENLKEFSMYMLGLIKSRALKAGHEPTDRRVYDMRQVKGMGPFEMSLYLYPRIIAIHNLDEADGFPNEKGHLRMPQSVRASYSRVDEGGVYIVDNGQICLLWIHAQVSPNLLEDLFGPGINSLQALDPLSSSIPVLETHLNAQVRNILQYLEDNRGSKGLTIQLARQGLDGAEYEYARLLYEDRNNEAQSYVDWLVHVHRHVQLELQGQRGNNDAAGKDNPALNSFRNMKLPWQ